MLLSWLLVLAAVMDQGPTTQPPGTSAAAVPKSYVSEDFGFSFEYPASWKVVEQRNPSSTNALLSLRLLSREQDVEVSRDYSPGGFGVEVFSNPKKLSVEQWLDQHGWPFGTSDRSVTTTQVAGESALAVTTGKMYSPNRFIYVGNDRFVLRLSPIAAESAGILNSFRLRP